MATRPNGNSSGNKGTKLNKRDEYRIEGVLDYKKAPNTSKTAYGGSTASSSKTTYSSSGRTTAGASKTKTEATKTAAVKSSSKKKSKKNNYTGILIALLSSTALAGVLAIFLVVSTLGKRGQTMDIIPTVEQTYDFGTENYVSIDAESFTLLIGESVTLSVSSFPIELAGQGVWFSNDKDIVYIDQSGCITALSAGVVAINFTVGELTDAIAVEVVADASSDTKLGLPLFGMKVVENNNTGSRPEQVLPSNNPSGNEQQTIGNSSNGSTNAYDGLEPSVPSNNQPSIETTTVSESETGAATRPNEAPSLPAESPFDQIQNSSRPEESDKTHEETSAPDLNVVTQPQYVNMSIDTDEMFSVLSNAGFEAYLPSACVYEDENLYYGEIIVEPDSVHIYIKNRNADFDEAVKGALSYLLPEKSNRAWNTYLSARADTTLTLDGRKVRIVVGTNQAHSQIIVYNE